MPGTMSLFCMSVLYRDVIYRITQKSFILGKKSSFCYDSTIVLSLHMYIKINASALIQ